MMRTDHRRLLLANKAWVQEKLELRPDYFQRMAEGQQPQFLWIGCSDSRVPAEEITGTEPGEIFVHRNVGNLVVATDLNLMAVVQYAIDVLRVEHVIVCGHYGCGGVRAALGRRDHGPLNKWLRAIKDVHRVHREDLVLYHDLEQRADRLAELNVLEQVQNLVRRSIVQKAWRAGRSLSIHGWVYGLDNGLLKDLVMCDSIDAVDEVYRFVFDDDQ